MAGIGWNLSRGDGVVRLHNGSAWRGEVAGIGWDLDRVNMPENRPNSW